MASIKERASRLLHRRFLCLVTALGLLAGEVRAALQFDVFVGYGDVVADASWFPAVFEIKNDGATFSGYIEISNMQMGQGQTRRIPIELPTGTLKRVVVPVFCSALYEGWNFRLQDEHGRTKAEYLSKRPGKTVQHDTLVIGAVSRTQAGLPVLPPLRVNQPERQPVAGRMLPALFPDNPIALEGCKLIYLNSEAALTFSVPQSQALQQWMLEGGHLVVAVEQLVDLNGLPWLRNLLPLRPASPASILPGTVLDQWIRSGASAADTATTTGRSRPQSSRAVSLPGQGSYRELKSDPAFETNNLTILTGVMLDGRVSLAATDGQPLMVEASRGRGRVTLLTFNPEREPFLSWKNKGWFWPRLGGVPGQVFESSEFIQRGGWSLDGLLGAMIDSKQVRKLPLAWLLVLLVAYLLVIGPFDRYWLKKINRQMLTWITFPCYVVFFSGLIYFIGFKLRAGDSELNELSFVDVLPGSLRGRTFTSIYSPANNTYTLTGEQRFSTMRGEFMGGFSNGGESSRGDITTHGNGFEARVFVPVWTSQMFISDWLEPSPQNTALTVKAATTAGGWKITVENRLPQKLTEAQIVVDHRIYRLGDLPTGGPREFTFQMGQGMPLADFVHNLGSSFLTAAQNRRNTFGNNPNNLLPELSRSAMAASFTSLITDNANPWQRFISPRGLDLASAAEAGQVILLAWDAGHSATRPFNRFEPRRLHRDSLYRLVQPLNPVTAPATP